jgi:hypothetical protein
LITVGDQFEFVVMHIWCCIDLQGLVKTAKYRKRCFDQIQGISEDNKELTAKVDRLRKRLETAEKRPGRDRVTKA